MRPWLGLRTRLTSSDSRIVSTLSSCAESMNEHVLTINTSAFEASLMISTPSLSKVPTMTSESTRFLAQPKEINPTRNGRCDESFIYWTRFLERNWSVRLLKAAQGQDLVWCGGLRAKLNLGPEPPSAIGQTNSVPE